MNAHGIIRSLLAALTLATSVAAVTGCSAPVDEASGSSSSKLLAPHAVFKGPATAETQAALGISEWRIYRGKTAYIVTGYNSAGKAVKGVSLAFAGGGAARSSRALLTARLLDGSKYSATHAYGGSTTSNASLGDSSQSFVSHAVHDMTALRMDLKTSITQSAVRTGEACSGDMVKIVMNSLQCMKDAATTGSSVSKQIKLKQCAAAAESASNAVTSCQNAATQTAPAPATTPAKAATPATPAKTTGGSAATPATPAKDTSAATQAAADKAQDAAQDKADAKTEAADKAQDAAQDKADDAQAAADKAQDAAQDKADDAQTAADKAQDTAQDAAAGADAGKAASDQTCTSCQGSATDVSASDTTGAVSAQSGDAPAAAPAADPAPSEPAAPDPGTTDV